MKQQFLASFLAFTRLREPLAQIWPSDGVVILNYHRIGDALRSPLDRGIYSTDADGFDAQMSFLKRHCDVIAPDQIEDALRTRRGRHVVITFDDGYRDNYSTALPVLRRHGLTATFFVTTGFIDRPQLPWWDEIAVRVRSSQISSLALQPWLPQTLALADDAARETAILELLRTYKQLPGVQAVQMLVHLREACGADEEVDTLAARLWMNWDMIRDLCAQGMTTGGHTVTHPLLARISDAQQWQEISTCAARLEQELGQPMHYFAYPVGSRDAFNQHTLACLKRAGVRRAFSYYGGYVRPDAPALDTRRMPIARDTSSERFRAIVQLPQLFARLQH